MANVFITDTPTPDAAATASPTSGASGGQAQTGPHDSGQETVNFLDAAIASAPKPGAKEGSSAASPAPATPGAETVKFLDDAIAGKKAPVSSEPAKPSATATSIVKNVGAGLNEGMADTLGLPVDAVTGAMNLVSRGINAATGTKLPAIEHPFGGSESIKSGMGLIGANPNDVAAPTPAEAIARGAGAGVAGALIPQAGIAGLAGTALAKATPAAMEAASTAFGTGASAGSQAALGAAAGATGEGVASAVPEPFKPAARFIGNLAGGIGAAAAGATPGLAASAVKGAREFAAPMTTQGQKALADHLFAQAVADRAGVQERLANPPPPVPGSNPTTAQVADDVGVSSMERAAETAAPVPFNTRRAEQNSARVEVLNNLQATGDPAAVAAHVRAVMDATDASGAGAEGAVRARAQGAASGIGTGTPEDAGAAMRQSLVENNAGAKAWEGALWDAVDPDGKLAMGAAPITNSARRIIADVPKAAKPIEGEEAAIFKAISDLAAVSKFREIVAIRKRISDEMRVQRGQNGNPTALARLTQLRGVVEKAIEDAAEHKAGQEAEAVKSGAMKPEETMAAKLAADREQFYADKRAARGDSGEGNAAGARMGSASSSGGHGAVGKTGRGPASHAGAPGVSGEALSPNLDAETAARIKAASAATKERAQTFKQGPVGETLAEQGTKDNFRVLDSAVGQKFWKSGPTGAQAVELFKTAAGNDPAALAALETFAGLSLRKAAMNADGMIDPAKFAGWQKTHADALRAMPEMAKRFDTAAKAGEAVADATAMRAAAIDAYQRGALSKLIGVRDAGDVVKVVGSVFGQKDAIGAMRELASSVKGNPDARDGLRKAVADFLTSKAVSNTEDVKSDVFQTFIRQNRPVLAQVFSQDELKGVQAVAAELSRVNRIAKQAALPGRSTTAQDLLSQKAHDGGGHLSPFSEMMLGAGAGWETGGPKGAAIGAAVAGAKNIITSMRAAGMANVKDMIREMLLHPELAKAALERAPAGTGASAGAQAKASLRKFNQQLMRLSTIAATRMVSTQSDAGRRAR